MINIVMPMAGKGSRFLNAGYTMPKPLIPIHGRPMAEVVINNLRPAQPHRFIFLCLESHLKEYQLGEFLKKWAPNCEIIPVSQPTEGAACTVLLADNLINNDDPLMIANCDQWIDASIDDYLRTMTQHQADGLIMTMTAHDPKWSYIRFSTNNTIIEVVEKEVVSSEATVGVYNFRRGSDFVSGAKNMIVLGLRVNGEFYVAPVYNQLLKQGRSITLYNIGGEANGMYGLGIPSDLKMFESHSISQKATTF